MAPRVAVEECDDVLKIVLTRPEARNALDAAMRDELVEALEFARIDPYRRPVDLSGLGRDFCAGGDLNEFGSAQDLAEAHNIRIAHSPARLIHQLRDRMTCHLHGACIGAGIEMPAASTRVVASPTSWFMLPEVGMGLIPGAGGTVTLPRRIGRHRTCYLALSGERIAASTALAWGLVDSLVADVGL